MKTDGVPSIENSSVKFKGTSITRRGISSAKFLIKNFDESDEEDRLSNITDAFYEEESDLKFLKVYNMQGHYSARQSVSNIFGRVITFCL